MDSKYLQGLKHYWDPALINGSVEFEFLGSNVEGTSSRQRGRSTRNCNPDYPAGDRLRHLIPRVLMVAVSSWNFPCRKLYSWVVHARRCSGSSNVFNGSNRKKNIYIAEPGPARKTKRDIAVADQLDFHQYLNFNLQTAINTWSIWILLSLVFQ